ncbi:MAG: hypothetical protein LUC22_07490, partial [Prevotella sp.]|nr:hypothetical protein [Prevotella sp.]
MKRFIFVVMSVVVLSVVACGGKKEEKQTNAQEETDSTAFADDRSVYGLACEGCTDSIVWLLPPDASDPVPYNIVSAMRHHAVLGKIRTGDGIAIVVNPTDSTVADMVLDLE